MKVLSHQRRKELKTFAEKGVAGLGPRIDLGKVEETARKLSEVLAGRVKAVEGNDHSKHARGKNRATHS
jgi:hypothetical protein